jgi:hypothetical protein
MGFEVYLQVAAEPLRWGIREQMTSSVVKDLVIG